MEQTNQKTKRGRPAAEITWPQGEFTADEVFTQNEVSRVSIHNKINKAVAEGLLIKVSRVRNKIGRPSFLYILAGAATVKETDGLDF